MKKLLSLLIIVSFLIACDSSETTNTDEQQVSEVGETSKDEKMVLKNSYVADAKSCAERQLPITKFSIQYPDGLEVVFPDPERSEHINIKKRDNGFVSEEMSIGTSTITYNKKSDISSLLKNLTEDFKKQVSSFQVSFIGEKKFQGETTYLFHATVDYSAYKEQGYNGIYNIVGLLPVPKNDKDMNAILVTFMAGENSSIKSLTDFETSGMLSEVWKTFKYLD